MEANQNKAEGFLKQGSILAAASILVRLIGMFYRIPLANIIGDAGNGIYSAAFEVYNILLIISSYGMPMADGFGKMHQKRIQRSLPGISLLHGLFDFFRRINGTFCVLWSRLD